MKALENKAVVITGAGRGIGAACAKTAAQLGARVIVNDRDKEPAEQTAQEIRAAGGQAVSFVADITSWQGAADLIGHCVTTFGTIDGLVNNDGLFGMSRLDEMQPGQLETIFAVNVAGGVNCAHHAAKHMITRKSGCIVNVVSGAQMGIPAMGAYGASKGAMASFTYVWAQELAAHGIRVNAVSPMGMSRMVQITEAYQDQRNLPHYAVQPPPPEMNAGVVCFLLSDRARQVNGQVVRAEGKQLALVSHPMIAAPVLERDLWDFDAVAQAFDTQLAQRQLPIGIGSAEVTPISGGSTMWAGKDKPSP